MNNFQVGDRVSVEGVVSQLWSDAKPLPLSLIKIIGEGGPDDGSELWFSNQALTFIERPRRRLRVGSVWERLTNGGLPHRYVVIDGQFDFYKLCDCEQDQFPQGELLYRSNVCFDEGMYRWREVPVEELERETTS